MLCSECNKLIIGDKYVYSAEKDDNKKFCSQICCENHYAPNCKKCGKKSRLGLHKPEKNDGKKFCGTKCMNDYYGEKTQESVSQFWAKYKNWIIGGGVFLVFW